MLGDVGATAPPLLLLEQQVKASARWSVPAIASVVSHEEFGDGDNKVMVARLSDPILAAMQYQWAGWSTSQYGFKPHMSDVGFGLRPIGSLVRFNRIALWYGDSRKSYRLGTGELCA